MEERVLTSPARQAGLPAVDFYFDPISPYAWLATHELARVEAAGCSVRMVPVLFAGLLGTHGSIGPAEIPAKRAYLFRDVMREAARRAIPFAGPPGHPFNPLTPLRMCTALPDTGERRSLALALADISDAAVAAQVADAAGFDGAALLVHTTRADVKAALSDATARAAADGVFGVPTFRLGGELFWGTDRIDALLWRLAGDGVDEAALQAFLARPPLAQRRR
jgi:2-hydroxychromene-2-carboxylate isomerase